MKSYMDYLSEVEFEDIKLEELTEEILIKQEGKQGVCIVDTGNVGLCLMRKFEPMQILNTVEIFEKVNVFIVVDPFGFTLFSGTVNEVVDFTIGFYSEDEI